MRILIDANILLDVLQKREPHDICSSAVWKLCETCLIEGCFSTLTFANLTYVMRKELSPEQIKNVLSSLQLIFRITDLSANDLAKAAELCWTDYEDAIQSVIAKRLDAAYIVTRNEKDFAGSEIPAITPEAFIQAARQIIQPA